MKIQICNYTNSKRGKERTTTRNAAPAAANETYAHMIESADAVMEVIEEKGLPGGRRVQDCYDILVNGVAAAWTDPVSRTGQVEVLLVRLRKNQLRAPAAPPAAPAAVQAPSGASSSRRNSGSAGRYSMGGFEENNPAAASSTFKPFSGQGNRLDGKPINHASTSAPSQSSSSSSSSSSNTIHMPGATFHGQNNVGVSGGSFHYAGSSTSSHGVAPAVAGVRLRLNGGFFTADDELIADTVPQATRPQPWEEGNNSSGMTLAEKLKVIQAVDPNGDGAHLFEEAILGTRDTKVSALQYKMVAHVMDSVGKVTFQSDKLNRQCSGSFWMVSPHLLITNNHVLSSQTEAESATAIFFYESDDASLQGRVRTAKLDPDVFWKTSKALDYTLVYVDIAGTGAAGGAPIVPVVLPLYGDAALRDAFLDRPMFVIQHPRGKPKEVSTFSGSITLTKDCDRMQYKMDTEAGSSGSPVLNSIFKVIALHHRAIPKFAAQNKIKLKDGTLLTRLQISQMKISVAQIECEANQGVTVTAIVSDLIKDATEFLKEYPGQYRFLHELLMQDPSVIGSIPDVPAITEGASSSPAHTAAVAPNTDDVAMEDKD